MKKLIAAFTLVATVCAYIIINGDGANDIIESVEGFKPSNVAKKISSKLPNLNPQKMTPKQLQKAAKDVLSEDEKFASEWRDKYTKQTRKMAKMIEELKIDPSELDERASDLSFDEFLKSLPKPLRAEYKKFKSIMEEMQQKIMKADEISPEFFGQYQVTPPEWITDRVEQLKQVSLSNELQDFLNRKQNEKQMLDEDINFALNKCGKGNKTCIEKVFVSLMDMNHQFSEDQLKRIGDNL